MLTRAWARLLAGQRGSARGTQNCSSRPRHLSVECLEQRWLLAVDFPGWQNLLVPADVNNDGVVAPADALLVVHQLRQAGPCRLESPAASAAPALAAASELSPEGERPSRAYVDVNGDGYLSPVDAFLVVSALRAEGQTDSVQFRLETTDLAGTPISAIDQGQSFVLNVFVQDVRPDTVPNRGVFQAYVDVTFDDALVTAAGPLSYGDAYQEQESGSLATPGLVDEAGGTQTGFGFDPPFAGPLGPDEFLLLSVPFEAVSPGTVTFASDPADLAVFHDVTLFEPTLTVPSEDIVFGATSLTINLGPVVAFPDTFTVDEDSPDNVFDVLANDQLNTGGTLSITDVGNTDHGGTVVNQGDHLLYTPAPNFAGTETFTYTMGDGLGNTDQASVVVTVASVNDVPVANNDGGAGYKTDKVSVLTTGNVLANDTDADGDPLSVSGFDTTGTKGLVTDNGDGTFTYDPHGQFDQLLFGQQATDTFTYTVTDGNGGFDTATVTITVTGVAPAPGNINGLVYADVDNDGLRDSMERAIGGVRVQLEGTDIFGSPVSLSTLTDAQGRYSFAAVNPGAYDLTEVQPQFFLDGIDTVNGVRYTGLNDRIRITAATDLTRLEVDFGERSLHPAFLSLGDSINSALGQGIVVAFDSQGSQLWYAVLDGWNGVTSVRVTLSGDGSTANLTVSLGSAGDLTFPVPTSPAGRQFRVMGETSEGRVVQFIGTMADFQARASGLVAEGEAMPSEELADAVFAELGQ
jgi:VCBS repeat-containing protein